MGGFYYYGVARTAQKAIEDAEEDYQHFVKVWGADWWDLRLPIATERIVPGDDGWDKAIEDLARDDPPEEGEIVKEMYVASFIIHS
tara:strand:- start:572 stop:829 length:258 start_codon:yes stop_codon:yes gene_type:complete